MHRGHERFFSSISFESRQFGQIKTGCLRVMLLGLPCAFLQIALMPPPVKFKIRDIGKVDFLSLVIFFVRFMYGISICASNESKVDKDLSQVLSGNASSRIP